jgi:predicted transcriptional regulator
MNDKEKLIDYLNGEMDELEKSAFEQELVQNPALQRELEELQDSRDFLAELPDIEAPSKIIPLKSKPLRWKKWLAPIGIAASLLLLFDLFNFQINTTNNGWAITFGEDAQTTKTPATAPNNYVTIEDVQQLLESREQAHRQDLLMMDSLWQKRLLAQEKSVQTNINKQLATYQTRQQKDLATFANNLRQGEIPELVHLMQQLQSQQQEELKLILGDLWQNWQDTRVADLNKIRNEFTNVYKSQKETDAILVNMITDDDD